MSYIQNFLAGYLRPKRQWLLLLGVMQWCCYSLKLKSKGRFVHGFIISVSTEKRRSRWYALVGICSLWQNNIMSLLHPTSHLLPPPSSSSSFFGCFLSNRNVVHMSIENHIFVFELSMRILEYRTLCMSFSVMAFALFLLKRMVFVWTSRTAMEQTTQRVRRQQVLMMG